MDVFGSLKEPCKAGRPDRTIGTNGEGLRPRKSKLVLVVQDLSIKSLSNLGLNEFTPLLLG